MMGSLSQVYKGVTVTVRRKMGVTVTVRRKMRVTVTVRRKMGVTVIEEHEGVTVTGPQWGNCH